MSDDLPLLRDPDAVELTGTLERVVFHNEENGYTVLRLLPDRALPVEAKVKGAPSRTVSRDPVTCVGCGVCAKLCPSGAIKVEGGEEA